MGKRAQAAVGVRVSPAWARPPAERFAVWLAATFGREGAHEVLDQVLALLTAAELAELAKSSWFWGRTREQRKRGTKEEEP